MKISNIEIFKTCFWNEPIPTRKLDYFVCKNMQKRLKSKEKLNTLE